MARLNAVLRRHAVPALIVSVSLPLARTAARSRTCIRDDSVPGNGTGRRYGLERVVIERAEQSSGSATSSRATTRASS